MDYLVGIDLGSTNLKAIVYDTSGRAISGASRPTRRHNPDPDQPRWAIWQPEEIWGDVAEALREATGQLDDPRRIRGVAVTGMGMDGVPLAEDGRWLYPFISWHCPGPNPSSSGGWSRSAPSGNLQSAGIRSGCSIPRCGSSGWPRTNRGFWSGRTSGC